MTTALTLRAVKGTPLTIAEVDGNFSALQTTADSAVTNAANAQVTANNAGTAAAAAQISATNAGTAATAAQNTATAAANAAQNFTNLTVDATIGTVQGYYVTNSKANSYTDSHGVWAEVLNSRILQAGSYRVSFTCSSIEGGYAKIYKNGVSIGTQRVANSADLSYTEDFTFVKGDTVQVYGYNLNVFGLVYISELKFGVDVTTSGLLFPPVSLLVGVR